MKKKITLIIVISSLLSIICLIGISFASNVVDTVKVNEMSNLLINGAIEIDAPPITQNNNASNSSSLQEQNIKKSNVIIQNNNNTTASQDADAYYTNLATQTYINLYPNTEIDPNAIMILKKALIEEDIVNNKVDSNNTYNDLGLKFTKGKFLGVFHIVGYCPCFKCCGKWSNSSASGAIPTVHHTISVDKKVIPLGNRIIIDGGETANVVNYNGIYRAEDTGGAVKGNIIDIFRPTHLEAQRVSSSGKQYAYVYEAVPVQ